MKPITSSFGIDRRVLLSSLAVLPALSGSLLTTAAQAQTAAPGAALASWNDGPAKQAILDFVRVTTEQGSPKFSHPRSASPPSKKNGWTVISMKNDWKRIFAFE
jgi:hypothetical protein